MEAMEDPAQQARAGKGERGCGPRDNVFERCRQLACRGCQLDHVPPVQSGFARAVNLDIRYDLGSLNSHHISRCTGYEMYQ